MLAEELRQRMTTLIKEHPEEAIKEFESNPDIMNLVLSDQQSRQDAARARAENVKYVKMNSELQQQLEEKARSLKVTQGVLIGFGVLFLLSQLDN